MIYMLMIPVLLILFYVLSLMPGHVDEMRFKPFEEHMIAHRGLYDNETDAPENSLPAFRKAVDSGFGIELDVQVTCDGKLAVFHDEKLLRMCGSDVTLTDLTYDELTKFSLKGSSEKIPLFEEVFDIFRDKVPAIIEIKAHGDYLKTAKKLMEYLDSYAGDYLVQSFHPRLVRWFYKHRPDVIRGQLSTVFHGHDNVPWIAKFVATNLMTNFYARPNFISYDLRYQDQFSYKLMRSIYRVKRAAWTVQSKDDEKKAREVASIMIFDSFDPRK